jgi:hypothetical protein
MKTFPWTLPEYFLDKFQLVGTDFYKTVFEQSEVILSEKIANGDLITKRAFVIAGIAAPAMTLSIGSLAGDIPDLFKAGALLEATFCLITLCILAVPIRSRTIKPPGSSPKELFHQSWIETFEDSNGIPDNELVMKNLYLNLALSNETRISHNEAQNRERVKYVDGALFLICLSPLLSLGIASLVSCICCVFNCSGSHALH